MVLDTFCAPKTQKFWTQKVPKNFRWACIQHCTCISEKINSLLSYVLMAVLKITLDLIYYTILGSADFPREQCFGA